MNFTDWAPLKLLDSDLLSHVRLAYVFGDTGHEALLITDEDEVLACGANWQGCLGLGNEESLLKPVAIPELSKKKIKSFSSTVFDKGAFVCAYTFSGTVYFWGKNFSASNIISTPTILPEFYRKVSKVDCGYLHCSILTAEGEIFSFGSNEYGQLGNGTTTSSSVPTLIQGELKGKIVVKIACGAYFSVCVLDSGEVYAWGCNSNCQLGWSSQSYSTLKIPTRVPELNGVFVKKIICGLSYVMAINDINELFSWGYNNYGQLGLGDVLSRHKPTEIVTIGKVINIAAECYGSTSAAVTENFEVYMWGYCGGLNLKVPTATQFDSMYDVFAYYGEPRIMYKPMSRHFKFESVSESVKNSFGDVETSDLTIIAEEKEILVHKVILKRRSHYFKLLLQEPWVQENEKVIKINQNYDGIHAYLQYIYTGNLKATPEVALELLRIADEYQDLILKKLCEKSVRRGLTVENVADLFSLALKFDAKNLIKYCISYAGNHVSEVIKTPGFSEWDKDTYKQFIMECDKRKHFRSSTRP